MGVWESFLLAAAALKTPTGSGYNTQGVNFTSIYLSIYMAIEALPELAALLLAAKARFEYRWCGCIYVCVYMYICLSIYLSIYQSIQLSICIY